MSRPARGWGSGAPGQRAARSNGDGLSVRQIAVSGSSPTPPVSRTGWPTPAGAICRTGWVPAGPEGRPAWYGGRRTQITGQSGARSSALSSQVPSRTLLCQRPLLHGQHETAGCAVIGVAVLKDQDDGLQPRGGKGGGQQPGMGRWRGVPKSAPLRCPGRPPPQ